MILPKTYIHNQSGASAVEFALLSPLLIFMFVGTIDFGLFIMERMHIQNTAHAVADYVAQVQDDANVQVVAEEAYDRDFSDIVIISEFECECSDGVVDACPITCSSDDYQRRFVRVSASGSFAPLFPYPGIPNNVDLQTTVRMRVD